MEAGPGPPIDDAFAARFAEEWIRAWNSHDLDRVLAHYEDGFEMSSPMIPVIAGEPSGKLRGKPAVRAYWTEALRRIPDLRFEAVSVLAGLDCVVICYLGHKGLCAEMLHFGESGKVRSAAAHYAVR